MKNNDKPHGGRRRRTLAVTRKVSPQPTQTKQDAKEDRHGILPPNPTQDPTPTQSVYSTPLSAAYERLAIVLRVALQTDPLVHELETPAMQEVRRALVAVDKAQEDQKRRGAEAAAIMSMQMGD